MTKNDSFRKRISLCAFFSLLDFPELTRQQLALAGFIYRNDECICLQCGIKIHFNLLNNNQIYANNFFRKLHREKISLLGKRCAFLLCETGTNIDDLPSIVFTQEQRTKWIDAEVPEFVEYSARLQTFQSWPHAYNESSSVKPTLLAEHGFYLSGPNDGVTCFYCGNTLMNWSNLIESRIEHTVKLEHAKYFPCRFISNIVGNKFILDASRFHVVRDEGN